MKREQKKLVAEMWAEMWAEKRKNQKKHPIEIIEEKTKSPCIPPAVLKIQTLFKKQELKDVVLIKMLDELVPNYFSKKELRQAKAILNYSQLLARVSELDKESPDDCKRLSEQFLPWLDKLLKLVQLNTIDPMMPSVVKFLSSLLVQRLRNNSLPTNVQTFLENTLNTGLKEITQQYFNAIKTGLINERNTQYEQTFFTPALLHARQNLLLLPKSTEDLLKKYYLDNLCTAFCAAIAYVLPKDVVQALEAALIKEVLIQRISPSPTTYDLFAYFKDIVKALVSKTSTGMPPLDMQPVFKEAAQQLIGEWQQNTLTPSCRSILKNIAPQAWENLKLDKKFILDFQQHCVVTIFERLKQQQLSPKELAILSDTSLFLIDQKFLYGNFFSFSQKPTLLDNLLIESLNNLSQQPILTGFDIVVKKEVTFILTTLIEDFEQQLTANLKTSPAYAP